MELASVLIEKENGFTENQDGGIFTSHSQIVLSTTTVGTIILFPLRFTNHQFVMLWFHRLHKVLSTIFIFIDQLEIIPFFSIHTILNGAYRFNNQWFAVFEPRDFGRRVRVDGTFNNGILVVIDNRTVEVDDCGGINLCRKNIGEK